MNEIEKIKEQIVRQAIELKTGGFKPSNSMNESWIGKVYLYKVDEEIPIDSNGELMIPLLQLCFQDISFYPKALSNTKALTIFISAELPHELTTNGQNWILREYKQSDELIHKELSNPNSTLKPFPLKPENIKQDYPVWDGGGLTLELENKIVALEESGMIEDYSEIAENKYGHKIGGYPSFCQPGIDFGDNYEFVLQIASDEKVNLNIVDDGTIFFAKNDKTQEWVYYCDFY